MRITDPRVEVAAAEELVQQGIIDTTKLNRAKDAAQQDGTQPISYHLVRQGDVTPIMMTDVLARHYRMTPVHLGTIVPDEHALRMLSADLAQHANVLPLEITGTRLKVAMSNPHDVVAIDSVQFASGCQLDIVVSDPYTLAQRIDRAYNQMDSQIEGVLSEIDRDNDDVMIVRGSKGDDDVKDAKDDIESQPVVRLVNNVLHNAVKKGASDIHFEPFEEYMKIRFRVDGVLQEIARPSVRLSRHIIARVKILSKMDIGEKRLPQDGRTKLKVGNRTVDFRVSTTPVRFGEKAVLRILDKSAINLNLEHLGIDERGLEIIQRTLAAPYGMLISTGPTGSGKTTSLYSALQKLNSGDVNIMSAEDPIEYDLDGINQVQVKASIDLTFASVLRSFLRQDPDVIMVGEMRDNETAEIAIQAALTGHLVLSTLHTNDAAAAFVRLSEIGVRRFEIADAVTTIIAQRLVRKICPRCKQPAQYRPDYLDSIGLSAEEKKIEFMRGTGCNECDNIGYSGRVGLFEVLPVTPRIREAILASKSHDEIKKIALEEGMKPLRDIGIEKVRAGVTTLDEVVRQTSFL